jgi:hypothetical protein
MLGPRTLCTTQGSISTKCTCVQVKRAVLGSERCTLHSQNKAQSLQGVFVGHREHANLLLICIDQAEGMIRLCERETVVLLIEFIKLRITKNEDKTLYSG